MPHFHGMSLPFVIVCLGLPLMVISFSSHQFFLNTSSYILNTCEPNEFIASHGHLLMLKDYVPCPRLQPMEKCHLLGILFLLTNMQFNPTLNCLTYHTINPWHFPYFKSIREIASFKVKLLKIYLSFTIILKSF